MPSSAQGGLKAVVNTPWAPPAAPASDNNNGMGRYSTVEIAVIATANDFRDRLDADDIREVTQEPAVVCLAHGTLVQGQWPGHNRRQDDPYPCMKTGCQSGGVPNGGQGGFPIREDHIYLWLRGLPPDCDFG
ncbi:MAG TPA: hypothetical protein VF135_03545 [Terriglobales bacterium]